MGTQQTDHKRSIWIVGFTTFYGASWPVEVVPSNDEIAIKNVIERTHYKEPTCDVRGIKNEHHGLSFKKVGRRLVKRNMIEMDIYAFYPSSNRSRSAREVKLYQYL